MDLVYLFMVSININWIYSSPVRVENGYCDFPEYLYKENPGSDVSGLKWYTRSEYSENTEILTKEREIVVYRTEIEVRIVIHERCKDSLQNSTFPCGKMRVKQHMICVSNEADGKYRVKIKENEKSIFTCLKFIPRGGNLVQVWWGKENPENNDYLCSDDLLRRNPWPWVVETQREWSFCPLDGGYSYRGTLNGDTAVCEKEWKPSRLESECIHGEGIQFVFPKPRCALYQGYRKEELTVNCWGHWQEDKYLFVLMAIPGKRPQLVLRLTKWYKPETSIQGMISFSPVTSLRGGQSPPAVGVAYLTFTLSKNGGAADLTVSGNPECAFPAEYQGNWLLYEDTFVEQVKVTRGQLSMLRSGSFVCKGKHWSKNYYKMLSVFNNGCSPRFTCFNFRRDRQALLYQMSRSAFGDESFDMCQFENDPEPLGDAFRSEHLKLLLPRSSTQLSSCGLSVHMDVEVMFTDTHTCKGSISDWNAKTCRAESRLTMHLDGCDKFKWREFFCESSTVLDEGVNVLITYDLVNNAKNYRCWMIQPFVEGLSMNPWRSAIMYNSAQCGSLKHTAMVGSGPQLLTLTSQVQLQNPAYRNHIQQPCDLYKYTSRRIMQQPPTTASTTTAPASKHADHEMDTLNIYMNDHHSAAPKYGLSQDATTHQNRRQGKDRRERFKTYKNITEAHLISSSVSTKRSAELNAILFVIWSLSSVFLT